MYLKDEPVIRQKKKCFSNLLACFRLGGTILARSNGTKFVALRNKSGIPMGITTPVFEKNKNLSGCIYTNTLGYTFR